jgi:hypothetical protein
VADGGVSRIRDTKLEAMPSDVLVPSRIKKKILEGTKMKIHVMALWLITPCGLVES